jgi:hypothetical protein
LQILHHTVASPALPRLHTPQEVAEALGCSAWWLKEKARRRLIPFTYVGGAYRFTAEHVAEIVRLYEAVPSVPQRSVPVTSPARAGTTVPAERLAARPPRRLRRAHGHQDPTRYETVV